MVGADLPPRGVLLDRRVIAAARPDTKPPKRLAIRARFGYHVTQSLPVVARRHSEHMFAFGSDGGGRRGSAGEPGLEPELPHPKCGVLPITPLPKWPAERSGAAALPRAAAPRSAAGLQPRRMPRHVTARGRARPAPARAA